MPGDLVRTCMMIVYSLVLRRAAAMRILRSLLTLPALFCNMLGCCWSLLLDRAGTVAPELAATDAPVEVVATDAPVEVAATDAPTELAATIAPTELATTTDKIVQYCTAGFSYVPGGDCCCGPDCAVSRCGLGSGPNGECCAPEGVVPAGAFAAAPTPERQAYDPVIIETTVVIAPNGTAIANETVIVGGGRRDLATVLDEPTTRRLGAGNCVNGILNTQTSACCASSCGSCGGTGCSTRNGGPGYTGAQACCSSQVNAYPTCSATGGKGPCAAAAAPGSPAPGMHTHNTAQSLYAQRKTSRFMLTYWCSRTLSTYSIANMVAPAVMHAAWAAVVLTA
eukprot:19208-Heterococcus_DN1.PRE.1